MPESELTLKDEDAFSSDKVDALIFANISKLVHLEENPAKPTPMNLKDQVSTKAVCEMIRTNSNL